MRGKDRLKPYCPIWDNQPIASGTMKRCILNQVEAIGIGDGLGDI